MQAHAVIAFGSAITVLVVLCCLFNIISNKKKKTKYPIAMRTFTAPPVQRAGYGDVENGTRSEDGGMVILAGAGAAVATAAVVASVNGGDSGGGGGCAGGGGGCGG